jgi:hypothetical protein
MGGIHRSFPVSRAGRGHGAVRRLRAREDAIAFGLLVQLAACLIAPALHLIDHRADHEHLADGTVRVLPAPPPPFVAAPAPGWHAQLPAGAHGEGAAQHFGLALTAPVAAPVDASVGEVRPPVIASLRSYVPAGVPHGCAPPRGPPRGA